MIVLDEEVSSRFVAKKVQYESLSQAVKKVRQGSEVPTLDMKGIDDLVRMKANAKKEYLEEVSKLSKLYFSNENHIGESNLLKVGDWYGVAYRSTNKKIDIKFELLLERDLELLERSGAIQHYQKNELDSIIPAYIDDDALSLYIRRLEQRALEFIHDYLPWYTVEEENPVVEEATTTVNPSSHAAKRWVQRIIGIPGEANAEEYRRSHLEEVDKAIRESFESAVEIWRGVDDIGYWFDDNNIVYIVGKDNTIITLYEENFGFSKEINRSIVLMQIEEVRKAHEKLDTTEKSLASNLEIMNREVMSVEKEVNELQLRINLLNARKATVAAMREEVMIDVKLERERFNNQFNKLFRR